MIKDLKMLTLLIITLPILQPAFGQEIIPKNFTDVQTNLEDVQAEIVDTHNECRRNVTPPAQNMLQMGWNNSLAQYAAEYAAQCTCNHSSLQYRTRNGEHFGENILLSESSVAWTTAVAFWDAEKFYFIFGEESKSPTGHHTQVVWFTTDNVGCAVAYCPDTNCRYFYVCMYRRLGNLIERKNRPYDEGETCAKCKNNCIDKLCQVACPLVNENQLENCQEVKLKGLCDIPKYGGPCNATCKCPEGSIFQ